MHARKVSALVGRKSPLMDAKLQPCGKQAVLGAKCASKRGCPKERLRGRTMLRKASLACPKTVAGLSLVAFESPILAPHALSSFEVARNACPKPYELRPPTFLIRIASFQDGYLISGGFVGSPVRDSLDPLAHPRFCLPIAA